MRWALLLVSALPLAGQMEVPLRTRVQPFRSANEWREVTVRHALRPERTAMILCDMWDKHWCRGATERVEVLARRVGPLLEAARRKGIVIVHAPSETMSFYAGTPQRRAMFEVKRAAVPQPSSLDAPPLPVDSSDGGCDTEGDSFYKAWSRQHPAIAIGANDYISDNGEEVYSLLRLRGVDTLLVLGVHANMCILNRSFAIKQMTKWGVRCILVRDLTDAMYDPKDAPHVSHERGTELVIEHIEKYWAPSVLSADVIRALE